MTATSVKQQFHCSSCGHRQEVRVQPRGCPVCHAPSPRRAAWIDEVLASRLRDSSSAALARV